LGLLGPNGAGKSTLLKMIATVSKPTEGTIILNRNNILKDANYMRKQLGFLPQDFGVYPNLNAYEFLEYIAALKGIGGTGMKQKIKQLLEGLNLLEAAKKPIGSYSGGMKQRVGIAQALLNDPKIVIFDEPTVGLDPEERVRFRNLISDLSQNCIVILSSQENLIHQIAPKVFETTISREQLEHFGKDQIVVSTSRKDGMLHVRYISENPKNDSIAKPATLEDAYLYLTKTN